LGLSYAKRQEKAQKRYAKTQNKRTKTCAFKNIVVSLHQKKKQTISQTPKSIRNYETD
jgi:hypothetical protein